MLYEDILTRYSDLFTEKEVSEIKELLNRAVSITGVSDASKVGENKYLIGVIMVPFILNEPDAYRRATQNMLVFCEEAVNSESAYARLVVNETIETPFSRLKWFYVGLSKSHPIYPLLLAGENGTRRRKGLQPVDDSESVDTSAYSLMQTEAINEITNATNPAPNFWWD